MAQREFYDMLGVLEPESGGVILRDSIDGLDWLAQQISRFPFDFVLRAPAELRGALRRQAERLLAITTEIAFTAKGANRDSV